ncbi:MAG: phenylalanine--tRNA ligase subunit alpha [Chitinophagales bacterium]|nr:phenylalanine--tRNA ligase subunit alpha [Chitinophagales bacterium]MCO5280030.1 phenylalanine--tRNA ligase subunit alpha [Chitinophagales bacterium]OJV28335.1 MAG: phenylalanine--tRNA ligase subunit alpha [Bacteroidetes bacterium 37-13]
MSFEKANEILKEIEAAHPENADALEQFRIKYLGTKGVIKDLFGAMKNIAAEQRKDYGQLMNTLKVAAEQKHDTLKAQFSASSQSTKEKIDITAPAYTLNLGTRHPVSIIRHKMIEIFSRIGFTVAEGPEIEDDWHNFTALNTPEDHPARDMQDTFFLDEEKQRMLRSQTSTVQIRVMETQKPPIRIICPGRVYRNETISARAHCTFHQVEGLYIDTDVSFADLKQTMLYFAQEMFGKNVVVRFRPSFFPFTEPSAEMDISCFVCEGKGCPVCKQSGWVEIGGCGMVDPAVLENCKVDAEKYTGFAFGMGIERITMLKYRINDLRLFFENDVRFLKQFESAS